MPECELCNGTGQVACCVPDELGGMSYIYHECADCGGTGVDDYQDEDDDE